MTITSGLRFLYIFGGSGLLCAAGVHQLADERDLFSCSLQIPKHTHLLITALQHYVCVSPHSARAKRIFFKLHVDNLHLILTVKINALIE